VGRVDWKPLWSSPRRRRGEGRGTMRSMVEGQLPRPRRATPSTTLRVVPLPILRGIIIFRVPTP
jgi:hypothetical protein